MNDGFALTKDERNAGVGELLMRVGKSPLKEFYMSEKLIQ